MKNLRSMIVCIAALLILASGAWAADAPFYKGKTIRIVVGYSPEADSIRSHALSAGISARIFPETLR